MMLERNAIDILQIRKAMGVKAWRPARPFGDDAWMMDNVEDTKRIIVSVQRTDGQDWFHASMSYRHEGLPTWEDMSELHRAVWGTTGWSYEVHPPESDHVNFHPRALHLWGRVDGQPVLPNFGAGGMI